MKDLLATTKKASEEAAAAGLAAVVDAIASPIRQRYDEILTQALAWLPGDAPPPRKHTAGWTNAEREAWNLATRMRRHKRCFGEEVCEALESLAMACEGEMPPQGVKDRDAVLRRYQRPQSKIRSSEPPTSRNPRPEELVGKLLSARGMAKTG